MRIFSRLFLHILQMWKSELDLVRAGWQEDVEDKEKKIKLLQTAMQVGFQRYIYTS